MSDLIKKIMDDLKYDLAIIGWNNLKYHERCNLYKGIKPEDKFQLYLKDYRVGYVALENCETFTDFAIYLYNVLEGAIND